ncbi:hypothetical protein MASR1M59_11490 [Melaminivora sp.]
MFFVFGPSGQMFRGGPQQLTQTTPVRRVQRAQALRTRPADVQAEPPAAHPPPHKAAPQRVLDAMSAYVQTEHGPAAARQPLTLVRDVMSTVTTSIAPEVRVNDAWHDLAAQGLGQAPVVNAQGMVVGLLLRADMAPLDLLPEPGAIAQAIALARRPVTEVMVSPVPTVAPDTELRSVARVLLDHDLPGLPVTDEQGQLLGFVSRNDILRAVATEPPLDLWG